MVPADEPELAAVVEERAADGVVEGGQIFALWAGSGPEPEGLRGESP